MENIGELKDTFKIAPIQPQDEQNYATYRREQARLKMDNFFLMIRPASSIILCFHALLFLYSRKTESLIYFTCAVLGCFVLTNTKKIRQT